MTTANTVTIFGRAGGFGRLFARHLESDGFRVPGVDVESAATVGCIDRSDIAAVDECLASTDVVLLCTPESATIDELPQVAAKVKPGTLLVDIVSVKTNVYPVGFQAAQKNNLGYLSIHPMFAPDHGFSGGNVVFIEAIESPISKPFRNAVESWGVIAHDMTAEEHDRATHITQVACHAAVLSFLNVAANSSVEIESLRKVETPLSRAMTSLGARIVDNDPNLFLSIQKNNPGDGRQKLQQSLTKIDKIVNADQADQWLAMIESMKEWLGDFREEYVRHFSSATKPRDN